MTDAELNYLYYVAILVTVFKWIKLLVLDSNTLNHLTVCKHKHYFKAFVC